MTSPRTPTPVPSTPAPSNPVPATGQEPAPAQRSPGEPSSAERPVRSAVEVAGVPTSLVISIVSGVLAGVLGTGVHGNIWHVAPHVWIPWGALLALGLLLSLSLWSGTTTRRVWAAAVPGIVAYATAFVLAFGRSGSALVVLSGDSAIGLAGLLWFGGILVITLVAVVLTGRWWRRRRRDHARRTAADAAPREAPRGRA